MKYAISPDEVSVTYIDDRDKTIVISFKGKRYEMIGFTDIDHKIIERFIYDAFSKKNDYPRRKSSIRHRRKTS